MRKNERYTPGVPGSFIWLICLGLFFSQSGILVFPASLDLPTHLGGAIAKGISVPVLLAATVEVARNVAALWQEKLG